jgi:predicted nucleic acid-binding protein
MVIVDTTVWIDYLGGTTNSATAWLDREVGRQRLALTDLILCEVLQGIRAPGDFARVRDRMLRFKVFPGGGIDLAIAAAENYRRLRQRGYTVSKTIDCWIATFCIEGNHDLLHRDRDFDAFESVLGLNVVHP